MNALEHALTIVKRWEGCKLRAYPDPGSGGDPWTIGYGSTGPGIHKGTVWTQEQADQRLTADVAHFLSQVDKAVTVDVRANELGALTSLAYNIGIGAFRNSTLLKTLNKGDKKAAAIQFGRWVKAGGKTMQGLVNRRADERRVFEGKA